MMIFEQLRDFLSVFNSNVVAKNSLAILLAKFLGILTQILTMLLLTQSLLLEEFGLLAISLSISMILSIFSTFGLDIYYIRFYSAIGRGRLIFNDLDFGISGLYFLPLFSIIFSLIFLSILNIFPKISLFAIIEYSVFLLILVFLSVHNRLKVALLSAMSRAVEARFAEDLCRPIFVIVLLLTFSEFYSLSLSIVLICYIASAMFVAIFLSFRTGVAPIRLQRVSELFAHPLLPDIGFVGWSRRGAAYFVLAVCTTLNHEIDTIMVGALLGFEDAGIYRVATRLMLAVGIVVMAVGAVGQPTLARIQGKGKERRRLAMASQISLVAFGLSLVAATVTILLAKPALTIVGEGFVGAEKIVWILLIGSLFTAAASGFVYITMISTKKNDYSFILLNLVFVALNILLNFFLIVPFGAIGAAMATATTSAAFSIACASLGLWRIRRKVTGAL